jgi:hypothetical protein
MNWVDEVIVVLVVIQAVRGRSRGALVQFGGIAGMVIGYLLGVIIAPSISSTVTHARWRPILALAIVTVASLLFSHFGTMLGAYVRQALKFLKIGVIDSVAGIVLGGAATLVVCWLFAGLVGATSWSGLDRGIQRSEIVATMDSFMPSPASLEARVQALFRYGDFPSVFANVVAPTLAGPVPTARLSKVVTSLSGPVNVVKVIARGGCANDHQGTAFFVGAHTAITNAHVIAGSTNITIAGEVAYVALFDPRNDIAVLRVPSLSESSTVLNTTTPSSGRSAEVVGYPGGHTRTGSPAIVRGEITAISRDIYSTSSFSRTVLVVNAQIAPGSSGSPVFVGARVVGVIFAKSYGQELTAYAVPASIVRHDFIVASAKGTVSTQTCVY